jgi:hypothetical protein
MGIPLPLIEAVFDLVPVTSATAILPVDAVAA